MKIFKRIVMITAAAAVTVGVSAANAVNTEAAKVLSQTSDTRTEDATASSAAQIVYQSANIETAIGGAVKTYPFVLPENSEVAVAVVGIPKSYVVADIINEATGALVWTDSFSESDFSAEIESGYVAAKRTDEIGKGTYSLRLTFARDVYFSLAIAAKGTGTTAEPAVPAGSSGAAPVELPEPEPVTPTTPATPTVPTVPTMPAVSDEDEETAEISSNYVDLAAGCKETLKITGTSKTVVWKSNNISVAAVSNGVVTAKKVGSAIITASTGDQTLKCRVQVSKNILTGKKAAVSGTADGSVVLQPYSVKFSKSGDLVVKAVAVNRSGNVISYLKNVNVKVKTQYGSTIGTYRISKQAFKLADDKSKTITFTIKKSQLKLKSGVDLRTANAAISGKYVYYR